MDIIIVVLLVLVLVKFVIIGALLLVVFRPDLRQLRQQKKAPSTPTCLYCQSKWTRPLVASETRWDGDDLVLVTTYECDHCRLPFWHVERVRAGSLKS